MLKNYLYKTFICALIALLPAVLLAQNTLSEAESETLILSLKQAQEFAYTNNVDIKNANIDKEIAKKKVWETTAIGLPQISGAADYNNMLDIPTSLIPAEFFQGEAGTFIPVKFGTQHNMSFGLSVSQLLFSGEDSVGLQASRAYLEMSNKNLIKAQQEIKESVANTYFTVLLLDENIKILNSSTENLKSIIAEMDEMLKVGFIEDTEVDQLRIELQNIENSITNIKSSKLLAERLLKIQIGVDHKQNIQLTENLLLLTQNADIENTLLKEFDINQNIDYQLVENQEMLSLLSLKREKSLYLPQLAGFISYEKNAMRDEFNFFNGSGEWYPTSVVGLQLTVPIFSSGMRNSKISQAKYELKKVQNTKSYIEKILSVDFETAKTDLITAYDQYKAQQKNMKLSKKIYEKTQIKLKEGISSSLEYTQIHGQYLQQQIETLKAIHTLLNAKVHLLKVINSED